MNTAYQYVRKLTNWSLKVWNKSVLFGPILRFVAQAQFSQNLNSLRRRAAKMETNLEGHDSIRHIHYLNDFGNDQLI